MGIRAPTSGFLYYHSMLRTARFRNKISNALPENSLDSATPHLFTDLPTDFGYSRTARKLPSLLVATGEQPMRKKFVALLPLLCVLILAAEEAPAKSPEYRSALMRVETPYGYEGLPVDGYQALLAVLSR